MAGAASKSLVLRDVGKEATLDGSKTVYERVAAEASTIIAGPRRDPSSSASHREPADRVRPERRGIADAPAAAGTQGL